MVQSNLMAVPFLCKGGSMKRALKAAILFLFMTGLFFSIEVNADPNMDGGGSGGGTEDGTSQNFYSSGDDGVRITVLDKRTGRKADGTYTIDYSKRDKSGKSVTHFGKTNKIEYMGVGGYMGAIPLQKSSEDYIVSNAGKQVAFHIAEMPTIISSSQGNSDIEVIKTYFNNEDRLRGIASRVGMTYDEMINGYYKVIIEPVIYLTFNGRYMALTAHEAAKLDIALGGSEATGGQLRAKFVSFTHKNLPLSIFLRKKELGIKSWTGGKNVRVTNGDILSKLGIGILSFTPEGSDVEVEGADYTYRPNTDVITSINVSVGGWGDGATVDNPITVRFSGEYLPTTNVSGIVIPPGGSRLVWVKWRTPDVKEKTRTTIQADIVGGGQSPATVTLNIRINPIEEKEPYNPVADDKKPQGWSDFIPVMFPKIGALVGFSEPQMKRTWHTYTCTKYWEETGEYVMDIDGEYVLDGGGNKIPILEAKYRFATQYHGVEVTGIYDKVKVDKTVEVANPKQGEMKSGYGFELSVQTLITGDTSQITGMQTMVAYFPEFSYKQYRRIGKNPGAGSSSTLEFPVNLYSIKKSRIHFTPIWYPDGVYKPYVEVLDAWTPSGMLCYYRTPSIQIKGSMWDDWHIGPIPN